MTLISKFFIGVYIDILAQQTMKGDSVPTLTSPLVTRSGRKTNSVLWSSKYTVYINWALIGWHYGGWYVWKHSGVKWIKLHFIFSPWTFIIPIVRKPFPSHPLLPSPQHFQGTYSTSRNMFGHQTARYWSAILFIYKSV